MPNSMKVFLGAPYHIDRSTFLEGVAGVFKTGHRTLYESLSSLVVGLFYSFCRDSSFVPMGSFPLVSFSD